jgi:hypothetical protein
MSFSKIGGGNVIPTAELFENVGLRRFFKPMSREVVPCQGSRQSHCHFSKAGNGDTFRKALVALFERQW